MPVRTPLELWNRSVHSYESIPENADMPHLSFLRGDRRNAIVLVTAVGLCCLGFFAWLGSYWTIEKAHQETVVPTLLSVIDPVTRTHIYALTNPLYEEFQQAHILPPDQSLWTEVELPEIWLDKTHIEPGESLTIFWTVGRDTDTGNILLKESDVIALYCDEAPSFLEAATIAQVRATSKFNGGSHDSWMIPAFPDLRQDSCRFRLFSSVLTYDDGPTKQFIHLATSDTVRIKHAKETPTAIHLALTDDTSTMIVQFTTGEVRHAVPIARIAPLHERWQFTQTGTTTTYTAEDLCQSPANLTQAGNFYPPGMLHTISFHNLNPSTKYKYQVGLLGKYDEVLHWSDEFTFQTPPEEGDTQPIVYVVYGDQGCPYHGWKGGQEWLEAMLERETNLSAVHHFGDISYARGAAHVWDSWFRMVQPLSARVPLMVAVGNHEYDHTNGGGRDKDPSGVESPHGFMPSWGNFGDDSGGECGVPMAKRFHMPASSRSNGVFWYSFNYGSVHTVVISSEHDLSPGSPQYKFLEHDLANVDRGKFPWVVLESHRPLYEGEGSGNWWAQNLVGQAMRDEFEDLLLAHQVDLVLAGHYHEYQRTCDGLYRAECAKGGPMHITVGSAGAKLDDGFELVNQWTEHFIKGQFGYGRVTVANATDMHFEFVLHGTRKDDQAGKVLDEIWVHRNR